MCQVLFGQTVNQNQQEKVLGATQIVGNKQKETRKSLEVGGEASNDPSDSNLRSIQKESITRIFYKTLRIWDSTESF